ncbi:MULTISPECIES: MarR family transcriptional regulator [Cupriavidus]|nr:MULTISPECIES: MarR family transcriptional regulator [Cupriavidus]
MNAAMDTAMHAAALALGLAIQRAHAGLRLKLDDELGRRHGIGLTDFALLDHLDSSGGQSALAELMTPLGLQRSAVLKRVLTLEKIGLVARCGLGTSRSVALRPAARAVVSMARETVASICAGAAATLGPSDMDALPAALRTFAAAPGLRLA